LQAAVEPQPEDMPMLKGIQFVMDSSGKKTAVIIDLKQHGELWEDFYDAITAHRRRNEPRESIESVRRKLRRSGKLDG